MLYKAIFFSALLNFGFCPIDESMYIKWHQRRVLEWKDFQGKVWVSSSDTRTAGSICGFTVAADLDGPRLSFRIECTFNKKLSWAKKEHESSYELNHEQVHFDIAEVNARKCRRAVSNFVFKSSTLKHDIDSLGAYYDALCLKEQNLYDLEADNGRDKAMQEVWNKRVAEELENEKSYWNPAISKTLNKK